MPAQVTAQNFEKWNGHQHKLLKAFAKKQCTDEEAHALTDINPYACTWKRVGDLRDAGFIEYAGKDRKGRSGKLHPVYKITDRGRAKLNQMVTERKRG